MSRLVLLLLLLLPLWSLLWRTRLLFARFAAWAGEGLLEPPMTVLDAPPVTEVWMAEIDNILLMIRLFFATFLCCCCLCCSSKVFLGDPTSIMSPWGERRVIGETGLGAPLIFVEFNKLEVDSDSWWLADESRELLGIATDARCLLVISASLTGGWNWDDEAEEDVVEIICEAVAWRWNNRPEVGEVRLLLPRAVVLNWRWNMELVVNLDCLTCCILLLSSVSGENWVTRWR